MAALLTLAQIRDHVETDLVDDVVQRLIDDADAEIIRRLGPLETNPEVLAGGELYLFIARKSTAIVSATERIFADDNIGGPSDTDLSADDYNLLSDGYRVERLNTGTNQSSYWRGMVTIVTTPVDETVQRKRLLADLVKLATRYGAVQSEAMGDARTQGLDYNAERERLFRGVRSVGRRLLI